MIPANLAPQRGETITAIEIATARIPTPMINARDILVRFREKPSMILAIPLIKKATPTNITIVIAVATGKDIAKPAKMRTKIPSPILINLDLPGENIPTMMRSIPTNNRIRARIHITEIYVMAGNVRE